MGASSGPDAGGKAHSAAAGAAPHTRAQMLNILLAVGLGIILEWYDFVVFSNLSAPITKAFFPPSNPTATALSFWGVFAVGFVARPAGSVLFGHIGDVHGRKPCLIATVSIMGVATVLIGCLPTYQHVGIAAPVLLALLRLVQGLAMGGEFGCSLVYLYEVAPPKRRGFSGSMGFAAAIGGIAVGTVMVMIVTGACSPAQLDLYGWRVPFLVALVTASAALLLRMHMQEPAEWKAARAAQLELLEAEAAARDTSGARKPGCLARARASPVARILRNHWWQLLLQFLFEASVSVSFWLCTSYLPGFFQKTVGLAAELALGMLFFNLVAMCPVILLSGWACDRPGYPRVAAALGAYVLIGAMSLPMFLAFKASKTAAACWLLQLVYMLLLSWVLGMLPVSMSTLYPATERASAFNIAHNCAMSLMGGLAPTVVTAISATTGNTLTAPGWYMLAVTLLSIVAGVVIMFAAPQANKDPPEPKGAVADAAVAVESA